MNLAEAVEGLLREVRDHEQAGRLDAADDLLRRIAQVAPTNAHAMHLQGLVAFQRGRIDVAADLMERSVALAPGVGQFLRNLAEVQRTLGRLDLALRAARRAVSLAPEDTVALVNLAIVHHDRGEFDRAEAAYERAIRLAPDFHVAHYGLSEILLGSGEFERGWEEYEWRLRFPQAVATTPARIPAWNGEPVDDGRLLVIADQGVGDAVMFARYLPWLAARAPDLVIACSAEIMPLLTEICPQAQFRVLGGEHPPCGAYTMLSGLPRLHGTRAYTIPASVPYLRADPEWAIAWKARLDGACPAGRRRIGIVWAGQPAHRNDRNRSATFESLAPLGVRTPAVFVALQKGQAAAQAGRALGGAPLLNLGPELASWPDTMAVLESLDLLITVDTAIAHIAGAMGRKVWLLLPFAADWRWLRGRSDTPWYPGLRLFRQAAPRDWRGLVARVAATLAAETPD